MAGSRIQSVDRTLDILEFISSQDSPVSLAEISGALDLNKVTCHKHLATLEGRGYVKRVDGRPLFTLGYQVLVLGQKIIDGDDIYRQALHHLRLLRDASQETAALAIRIDKHRVFIVQFESPQPIRHSVPIGRPLPLVAGASGKAILAFAKDAQIDQEIDEQLGDRFVGLPHEEAVAELEMELEEIRKNGYATSDSEVESNTAAIAAPIISLEGMVVGALSLTGPADRFSHEQRIALANQLVASARAVSVEPTRVNLQKNY